MTESLTGTGLGPDRTWAYATLTLDQPGWPGTMKAKWVAETRRGEQFRTADLLAALDRLGAQGWELVTFAPPWGDRSASFTFKTTTQGSTDADRHQP